MKIQGKTVFLLVIAAIVLAMVVNSLFLSSAAREMPLAVGAGTIVLIVIEFVNQRKESKKASPRNEAPSEQASPKASNKIWGYFQGGLWVGGFFVSIFFLGFIISMPCFIFAFMKTHKGGWFRSIILAAVTTGVVYFVFVRLMNVDLWPGLWFGGYVT